MTVTEVLVHCFNHFYHLDKQNAAIHTTGVRYSPITFRVAEALRDVSCTLSPEMLEVLHHKGKYEEDKGR